MLFALFVPLAPRLLRPGLIFGLVYHRLTTLNNTPGVRIGTGTFKNGFDTRYGLL